MPGFGVSGRIPTRRSGSGTEGKEMAEEALAEASLLLGRVLFGGVLALMGANHFYDMENMTEYTASKGVPLPRLAVVAGGIMMVAGGLSVVFGVYPLVGASVLVVFLEGSTPVVHDFWNFDKGDDHLNYEMINFFKNIALLGAALVFVSLATEEWAYGVGLRLLS